MGEIATAAWSFMSRDLLEKHFRPSTIYLNSESQLKQFLDSIYREILHTRPNISDDEHQKLRAAMKNFYNESFLNGERENERNLNELLEPYGLIAFAFDLFSNVVIDKE